MRACSPPSSSRSPSIPIYQFYLFLSPFAAPLFLASVSAILFSPIPARAVALLRGSRSLGAAAMTLGTLLLVLVPLVILLSMLVSEAADFYQRAEEIGNQTKEERQAILAWSRDHFPPGLGGSVLISCPRFPLTAVPDRV